MTFDEFSTVLQSALDKVKKASEHAQADEFLAEGLAWDFSDWWEELAVVAVPELLVDAENIRLAAVA